MRQARSAPISAVSTGCRKAHSMLGGAEGLPAIGQQQGPEFVGLGLELLILVMVDAGTGFGLCRTRLS
jgi:hypothetical protein